jgi:predicted N-acetyltransferase YhbS
LTVRLPGEWFESAIAALSVIVARRSSKVVGYVAAGEIAAQAHLPIIRAMLRAYPASPGAYLYGPICVAQSERNRGLAGALFDALRVRLHGRDSITFIRVDNAASRRAHAKMGMKEVAEFIHDGVEQIIVVYEGELHPTR